jgi:HAE1 family hydrophobic/amphiphilic exporter-1
MEHEASFLDRVTFNERWRKTAIARYFGSVRTIILVILTLSLAGGVTFFSLERELNPSIKIPLVTVSTAYPGASPEDVESLVTIPLEDAVSGLSDATSVTSSSQPGFSNITLEFSSTVDPDKAKADVQSAVDNASLPEDAENPRVQTIDFENQPVVTFALSGGNQEDLSRFSSILKDRLDDLPLIERVTLSDDQPKEIVIELSPEAIASYGLDPHAISDAVSTALASFPGGTLSSGGNTFALSEDRAAFSVDDLRRLPLSVSGSIVSLGEVSDIREQAGQNTPGAFYATRDLAPVPAVNFSVFKTDAADTGQAVTAVTEAFEKANQEYGGGFQRAVTFDSAKEIHKSFFQLFRDFSITVGLVFLVLILFFGLRQSIVASLAIPLTFLVTFLVMGSADISINFISLFSLLLALGILVDNAIVIISAMANYERTRRFTPEESALFVWNDFRGVILTTTITTVWAFLPLLLASGIIGEFIRPIPVVVSSALAISAAVALLIVIPMMAMLQRGGFPRRVVILLYVFVFLLGAGLLFFLIPAGPYRVLFYLVALLALFLIASVSRLLQNHRRRDPHAVPSRFGRRLRQLADEGFFDFHPLSLAYARLIRNIIENKRRRRKVLAALILFMLFSYALVPLGFVVNEFFPAVDNELVSVSLELPKGTPLADAEQESQKILDRLRGEDGVKFGLAELGAGSLDGSVAGGGLNQILVTLVLVPEDERGMSSGEFVARLNQKYQNTSEGDFSATQASGGPPAGADLQIKLLGDDLPTLEDYGARVAEFLTATPGTANVSLSIEGGSSKIVFVPDRAELAARGLSDRDLSFWLRTLGQGFTVKKDARFGEDERDVVIRFPGAPSFEDASALSRLLIPTKSGPVPLSSLGHFVLKPNPTLITREDGKRTLSVSAGVLDGYSTTTLNAALERFAKDDLKLPEGYRWKTGGVNEENNKSIQSILQAMLLSALLIFATMVVQFNSFRRALIVLLVIPIAVSGVFVIFGLAGVPLSFPALIGILALFGIVVNNSIIMVDKINKNLDAGLPLDLAVSEGAASRLEPILLTALTTIVGLIPITLSDPLWQGLGGAIISGLLFSGIAKLFFIPIAYKGFFGREARKEGEPEAAA